MQAKEKFNNDRNYETVIAYLKEHEFTKAQSIAALKEMAGISLDESTMKVHLSETWKEEKDGDDALNDLFFQVLLDEE